METICSLDVTDFPFDKQTCTITLGSWQYPAAALEMFCKHKGVDTSSYAKHSQWDLKGYLIVFKKYIYFSLILQGGSQKNQVCFSLKSVDNSFELIFNNSELNCRQLLRNLFSTTLNLISNRLLNTSFVLGTSCEEKLFKLDGEAFSSLTFTMKFQRLDNFYIRNLILPNGILLALSSLVFFLPSEDSGRIGFGMTVALSLFFNLVIVFDYIPETSKTFPSLCTYFLVSICLCAFAILLAAVSVNIFNATDDLDSKNEPLEDEQGRPYIVPEPKKRKMCGKGCLTKAKMKFIDRLCGVIYFICTTSYTLPILWKTF